jgi:protein-disulfide isomerase
MAQNRKTTKGKTAGVVSSSKGSKKSFYVILALAAFIGIATLSYLSSQGAKNRIIALDPNLPPVTSQGYLLGNPSAPLEIIEFGDFECPQCERFTSITEPDLRSQYINTGKVRFRFIDFPLNIHRNTVNASVAAACADEQGKFWEMHDQIFATQHEWNGEATSNPDKHFKAIARRITGLDGTKFDDCVDTRRTLPKVQAHLKLANDRQVNSTPTFVIGNRQYQIIAIDDFKQAIDQEMAALGAAGTKKP